jgi:hypothetical protein
MATTALTDIEREFASTPGALPVGEYNFAHFRTRHLLYDVQGTMEKRGISPGSVAPDFELPRVGGGTARLSDLRDQPVLLHFGSFT